MCVYTFLTLLYSESCCLEEAVFIIILVVYQKVYLDLLSVCSLVFFFLNEIQECDKGVGG